MPRFSHQTSGDGRAGASEYVTHHAEGKEQIKVSGASWEKGRCFLLWWIAISILSLIRLLLRHHSDAQQGCRGGDIQLTPAGAETPRSFFTFFCFYSFGFIDSADVVSSCPSFRPQGGNNSSELHAALIIGGKPTNQGLRPQCRLDFLSDLSSQNANFKCRRGKQDLCNVRKQMN